MYHWRLLGMMKLTVKLEAEVGRHRFTQRGIVSTELRTYRLDVFVAKAGQNSLGSDTFLI